MQAGRSYASRTAPVRSPLYAFREELAMGSRDTRTRRDFLKTAGTAVAAPYVITSTALGNAGRPAASDRIVMGGIGIGNMGRGDQNAFLNRGDVQYVAASDVRRGVRDKAKAKVDNTPPADVLLWPYICIR